ncbi:hypothetical protein BKE38_02960 [Pseudoroseomonas deserti]|uniref:Uncharacterized protein n=1 Tax=Teichococcus deserti TaxID=1817963 RepID=A0A1V2H8A8_9PROT|nr:hypothetical protein [Pseudoroseomonas deserti]ONG58303.1 hypothetical protein BKE38_02960 [Pseudoroseomonas deserti]
MFRQFRGTMLVLVALPLAPALLVNLISGAQRPLLGLLLGLGLLGLALHRLRRGRIARAALLAGVATGLIAGMAAGVPPLGAVVFGLMGFFGAKLLYAEAPPAVVEPPAPPPPPAPDLLEVPRARLAALAASDARLRPAVAALRELMAELALRPSGLGEARRFMNLQLDGLERIDTTLGRGAEPPPRLDTLVEDMARGSIQLRDRLRAAETEALEIQVKVLADRLREEGYA